MRAEQRVATVTTVPVDLEAVAREQLPRVERLLLRILGPRSDMEDLVQTVFVELYRALPRHRGEGQMSTFIGGIAINVARRAMRAPAFRRRRAPMPAQPPTLAPEADPERAAIAREQMARVRRALEQIRPKKRIAFCLWAFEGMEVREIAALTDASEAATWSRIWYAQKELRARADRDPALREALEGAR